MRRLSRLCALAAVLTLLIGCADAQRVAPEATATSAPISPTSPGTTCPVTSPNGNTPPDARPALRYHGTGDLYTILWPNGLVRIPPEGVAPDGALAMSFFWWRGRGTPPLTAIEGRQLDAASTPLRAEIPPGYDLAAAQPTTLIFPTPGCWEVTGKAGNASLTFVTQVAALTALPAAPPVAGCAVTTPNDAAPPDEPPGPGIYGTGKLFVGIPSDGVVRIEPNEVRSDGMLRRKFMWWRGPQVRGALAITGQRRDAPAPPLQADIPEGYGRSGFQATALIFPTPGCWEVTGRANDASMTFVLLILSPEGR